LARGGRKDNEYASNLGCSGKEMKIQIASGEIISTNNLWHQGKIPEHFRNILSNNAKFV